MLRGSASRRGPERLTEAGDEAAAAAQTAHGQYFLALAEAAAAYLEGPDQGRWFARLDADYPNLRRAAEHAASDPAGTAGVLRYGVALRGYWLARSRYRDVLGLLLPMLDRPDASADPRLFGAALVTVTCIAPLVDIAPARQYGDQAVELARQLGDDGLLADALGMLSAMHFFAGEPDRGLPRSAPTRRCGRPSGKPTPHRAADTELVHPGPPCWVGQPAGRGPARSRR